MMMIFLEDSLRQMQKDYLKKFIKSKKVLEIEIKKIVQRGLIFTD